MIPEYRWYKLHLNVICNKCNHAIPFQSVEGNPVCEECGTVFDKTWKEVIVFSKIEKVKQYDDGSTQLAGSMQLQMNYELTEKINCFHCHQTLEIPNDINLIETNCNKCNNKISFVSINESSLEKLVFYFHKNEKSNPKGNIIALRCASCAAPLQADYTKNEYNCIFCNTLNIIPPSLQAKKVLDDVYVGWNRRI